VGGNEPYDRRGDFGPRKTGNFFRNISLSVYDCDDLRECLENFKSIENLVIENGYDGEK